MDIFVMLDPFPSRSVAAAVLMLSAILSLPASAQSRPPIFTADREACFGRAYDRAHLASHPQQKVTGIHVLRSLGERPEAENWQPDQREEIIKTFREDGRTNVSAFVTFRDRKGTFYNTLGCEKEGKNGALCYIECDGGSFLLRRDSVNAVLLNNSGFVLIGGCGDDVEEGKEVFFSPGKDDKVFRLESKPVAMCRAEEQKVLPIRAGRPLRERFAEDESFCFGRDYDTAHLASHPQQMIASLRVGRLDPAQEKADNPDVKSWWFNVKLDVALTLKTGSAASAARYDCMPQQGSWECRRQVPSGTSATCSYRTIHLMRGPADEVLVFNRKSGLPIDTECALIPPSEESSQNPPTRSDDKTFRLTRMPVEACR
jgi:hypothetical protein